MVEELFKITSNYVSVGKRVPVRRIDRMHLGLFRIMFVLNRTFISSLNFLFSLLIVKLSTVSSAMRILFHDETVYCLYF